MLLVLAVAGTLILAVALWRTTTSDEDRFADYCNQVKEQREAVGRAMGAGASSGLIEALPLFEDLAAKAPDDISDEWNEVLASIRELRDALADADIDPRAYDPDHPPPRLAAADRSAIDRAAVRLAGPETKLAFAGVDQQARDVCKTPLFL